MLIFTLVKIEGLFFRKEDMVRWWVYFCEHISIFCSSARILDICRCLSWNACINIMFKYLFKFNRRPLLDYVSLGVFFTLVIIRFVRRGVYTFFNNSVFPSWKRKSVKMMIKGYVHKYAENFHALCVLIWKAGLGWLRKRNMLETEVLKYE